MHVYIKNKETLLVTESPLILKVKMQNVTKIALKFLIIVENA